jgi:hypothetical protein
MINKNFVYDKVLPLVKEKSRHIDELLILSLFKNQDEEIINELKKYQNADGGFGHCLEPDVRMPDSSVLATTRAVIVLHEVKEKRVKIKMIEDIVHYFESQYDNDRKGFYMVSKEVNNYPRAVWWNYEDIDKNFPFGNPDPEVIGFLYKYRKFLKKLNISTLVNSVVSFVLSEEFLESGFHSLISTLYFYKRVDDDIKNLIHDRLHALASKEIKAGMGHWNEYSLEPYKVYSVEPHFVNTHLEALALNLNLKLEQVKNLSIKPNWEWAQFEDVFEQVKHEWVGHLYFDILKAFRRQHII